MGRFCRPARCVPRGAQLHHRRRLLTPRRRPGRDCLRHGPGLRGPAGPAHGGPRRQIRGAARRRPALRALRCRAAAVGRLPPRRALPLQDHVRPARRCSGRAGVLHGRRRHGAAGCAWRGGLPRPAVAPDRQGRRLRVLPRAVHRLPGTGPDRLAGIRRTVRRCGLVQPRAPAARRRVRPGRRAPPGPRTAGPSLRRPRFRRPRRLPVGGGSVHWPRP
ncbi:hypothetical protein SRABI128_03742 [Microbacterium sp. Bi128]|nr:hypothetical protein SRABI128_03742 [Microbacterium sp. Bi128]